MARVQFFDWLLTGRAHHFTGVLHLQFLFFLPREYTGRGHQQRQKSRILLGNYRQRKLEPEIKFHQLNLNS